MVFAVSIRGVVNGETQRKPMCSSAAIATHSPAGVWRWTGWRPEVPAPTERSLLLDHFRPPDVYRFDSAIGTIYSLPDDIRGAFHAKSPEDGYERARDGGTRLTSWFCPFHRVQLRKSRKQSSGDSHREAVTKMGTR